MTSEAKGVRESVDEIPYDHEVWADLIRENQALANAQIFLIDPPKKRILMRLRRQRDAVLSSCLMLVLPWLL